MKQVDIEDLKEQRQRLQEKDKFVSWMKFDGL
jgi:hypothetical protein